MNPVNRLLRALPWPMPAVLAWLAGWALWLGLQASGSPPAVAFGGALVVAFGMAAMNPGLWRQGIAAAGFPLSALATGAWSAWPPWAWLLLLLPVLLLYPLRAWRDAPLFPTPGLALEGLQQLVPAPARALDAGCGLGHGLAEMRRLWPGAELHGLEWSAPLALASRRRCPGAAVHQGDMWASSWAPYQLVYLFQRPESMARAYAKACAELAPGSWLVSLEFEVPGQPATASLQAPGRRPVWAYRMGDARAHSMTDEVGR